MNDPSSSTTTASLHTLVYGDEDLLVEAAQAAQQNAVGTIRRVLRAVAVQALQQQLQQEQQQQQQQQHNHDNLLQRITITLQDIQAVQDFCKDLAKRWSDANVALGNLAIAATIQEIAQRERDTLYYIQHDNENDETQEGLSTNVLTTTATAVANSSATTVLANTKQNSYVTAYARCMAVPRTSLRDAITALDRLGTRHQTYWTESWRPIQSAAAKIPWRLYKQFPFQAEIVKSSNNNNDNDSNTATVSVPGQQEPRKAIDWLIDRKRKSVGRERLPKKRKVKVPKGPVGPPPSRPANTDDGEARWNIKDIQKSFSYQEKQALNALVMNNDEDSPQEDSPPSLILGALLDLGHYHYYRQSAIDYNNDDEDGVSAAALPRAPNKRRRHQRRSIAERLGDHLPESTDYGVSARKAGHSLIVQTVDNMQQEQQRQSWRDFDLQHVLVEVFDGTQRQVLALESCEFLLLDEDKAPFGWHDDGA